MLERLQRKDVGSRALREETRGREEMPEPRLVQGNRERELGLDRRETG